MSTSAPDDGAADALSADAPTDPPIALASSGEARCAAHPERAAHAICERCGDHLCAECRCNAGAGDRCRACLARDGAAAAVVPWEDGARPLALRVFASFDGLVVRPARVMARLPIGKRAPAYWLVVVVTFFPVLAVYCVAGEIVRGLSRGLTAAMLTVLAAWLGGLAAAAAAYMAGARGSTEQVGRAAAYAWTANAVGGLFGAVVSVLPWYQGDGYGSMVATGATILGFGACAALSARAMFAFARGRLKLGVTGGCAVACAVVSPLWLPVLAFVAISQSLR